MDREKPKGLQSIRCAKGQMQPTTNTVLSTPATCPCLHHPPHRGTVGLLWMKSVCSVSLTSNPRSSSSAELFGWSPHCKLSFWFSSHAERQAARKGPAVPILPRLLHPEPQQRPSISPQASGQQPHSSWRGLWPAWSHGLLSQPAGLTRYFCAVPLAALACSVGAEHLKFSGLVLSCCLP